MKTHISVVVAFLLVAVAATVSAAESIQERIDQLEPYIGGHPPQVKSEEELKEVNGKYLTLKSELDKLLAAKPSDTGLLFQRGYLQYMGHNFDHPDAWEGSDADLRAAIKANIKHERAYVTLGLLYVNSNFALASRAERLFRAAQCAHGSEPLESAHRGLWFALYYQGKMKQALAQSEYLIKTWPKVDAYRQLKEMSEKNATKDKPDGTTDAASDCKAIVASVLVNKPEVINADNGQKIVKEFYDSGLVKSIKRFHPDGGLMGILHHNSRGVPTYADLYQGNKPIGKMHYRSDGSARLEERFDDNGTTQMSREYDDKGKVISVKTYYGDALLTEETEEHCYVYGQKGERMEVPKAGGCTKK